MQFVAVPAIPYIEDQSMIWP